MALNVLKNSPDTTLSLSEKDRDFLFQLIKDRAGLVFTQEKSESIEAKLLPLVRHNGLKNLTELLEALRLGRSGLATQIINAVVISETCFYRDQNIFDRIKDVVLPMVIKKKQAITSSLRIWCAGVSSGQEAYTMAFLCKDLRKSLENFTVDILATDISASLIDRAKLGLYSNAEVQNGLPNRILITHFKSVEGEWQLETSIRRMIKCQVHNLLDDSSAFGTFDLILCRNVLRHFDPLTRAKVLKAFATHLIEDGTLVLGRFETMLGISNLFEPIEGGRGMYKNR